MGDIFKMKKDQLADLPVADPKRINLAELRELFRLVGEEPFYPFAKEFSRAAASTGPRYKLDLFFKQALSLPTIDRQHYELLSRDPVITKSRL